jgi:signal transduction histidine kinase
VLVDPNQLRNVLFNLVQNGIDAVNAPGGCVEIRVDAGEGRALCLVKDSGKGMEEAHVRRIFEPFFTTKGTKGTGLGMCIVKSLVEANQGRIQVSSVPGCGTTMILSFPLATAPRRAA